MLRVLNQKTMRVPGVEPAKMHAFQNQMNVQRNILEREESLEAVFAYIESGDTAEEQTVTYETAVKTALYHIVSGNIVGLKSKKAFLDSLNNYKEEYDKKYGTEIFKVLQENSDVLNAIMAHTPTKVEEVLQEKTNDNHAAESTQNVGRGGGR